MSSALIIGNSDGIGLGFTRRLLEKGWNVHGISRSPSSLEHPQYQHRIADVTDSRYPEILNILVSDSDFDLCVFCAGIGELLDLKDMGPEAHIVDVNFTGMVKTAAAVIPEMVKRGKGHFIGLSSMADELFSGEAPSYHASKAGFSNYLKSLSLATRSRGVYITNVRFGFVDTKMAKGDVKLLMMSIEKAVDHLMICLAGKPRIYSAPKAAIPLIKFRKFMMMLGAK